MAFPVEAFIQARKYQAEQRAPFSLAKNFGAGLGPGLIKGVDAEAASKVAQGKFRSDAALSIFSKFKPMRANPDPNSTDKWLEVDAAEYPSIIEKLQSSKGGELPGIKFLPITEPRELTPQKTYMVDKVKGTVTETNQPLFMGSAPKYLYSGEPAGMVSGQTDADILNKIETLASSNATDAVKQAYAIPQVAGIVDKLSKKDPAKSATVTGKLNELVTDIEKVKAYQSFKRMPADTAGMLTRLRANYQFLKNEGVPPAAFLESYKSAENYLTGTKAFTQPVAAPAAAPAAAPVAAPSPATPVDVPPFQGTYVGQKAKKGSKEYTWDGSAWK